MMRPRWQELHASPAIIAAIVLINVLMTLILQRLYIPGPATFYWRAIGSGWITLAFLIWLCYSLRQQPNAESHPDKAPGAAHLVTMAMAQWTVLGFVFGSMLVGLVRGGMYSQEALGRFGMMAVALLPATWMVLALMVLLMRCGDVGRKTKVNAILGTIIVVGSLSTQSPVKFWHADEPQAAAPTKQLELSQELMESQQQLLVRQLETIKPQRPGVIDVYAITYAPYEGAVFSRESNVVEQVMIDRFDAKGRFLQLINDSATTDRLSWATPLNLRRTIQRFAQVMDRNEDIFFIHLTSHGARNGELASEFWPLEVGALKPAQLKQWLDDAGIKNRVISISACYSGSWIDMLANENTLVMTAADAEHTSYGCGKKSELTFFGRAVYDEQLRTSTFSFEQAHSAARPVIKKREDEAGKDDGYSNPQIKVGAAIRTRLKKLEERLQKGQ